MHSPSRRAQSGEKYIVRFDSGQKAALKALAAQNRRSMNAEILLLIECGLAAANAQSERTAK
jgi:hypothetical protein